jgi:hypothetical protein
MARFYQSLNIANFICRFGDNDVLLDMAENIVIPAFLGNFVRTYSDTKYFFLDAQIIDVISEKSKPELALIGRYVKAGKIARDQIYASGKIIKDHKELESAPTSFFVLLLSNHKLLYVRENSGAPSLQSFSSTIEAFIKSQRKNLITQEFERLKETTQKITRAALSEKYANPEINIVELSSDASIQEFVKKFTILNTVEVKLLDTNHELDNSPLFGQARKVKDALNSDSISVKSQRKGLIGLNREAVAALISKPAEEGNSRITLKGVGEDGNGLSGNNDHFKLSVPIELPTTPAKAANATIEMYRQTLKSGMLSVQAAGSVAIQKIKSLRESLGYE